MLREPLGNPVGGGHTDYIQRRVSRAIRKAGDQDPVRVEGGRRGSAPHRDRPGPDYRRHQDAQNDRTGKAPPERPLARGGLARSRWRLLSTRGIGRRHHVVDADGRGCGGYRCQPPRMTPDNVGQGEELRRRIELEVVLQPCNEALVSVECTRDVAAPGKRQHQGTGDLLFVRTQPEGPFEAPGGRRRIVVFLRASRDLPDDPPQLGVEVLPLLG